MPQALPPERREDMGKTCSYEDGNLLEADNIASSSAEAYRLPISGQQMDQQSWDRCLNSNH